MSADPLARPIWSMLRGPQARLALGDDRVVRIDPAIGPFAAACDQGDEAQASLADLVSPGEEIWLVEESEWPAPPGMAVERTRGLLQMVHNGELPTGDHPDIELLDEKDGPEMFTLANANKPGPWHRKTFCYGPYFGIRRNGQLVAMAGERMRPAQGLAEVSGVCTDPLWRGHGFAQALMARVMRGFAERGDRTFLHTYADNAPAIAMYRRMGFEPSRELVVTVLRRDDTSQPFSSLRGA